MTREEVLGLIQEAVERLGSKAALAAAVGVSKPYVSDVCGGKREPGQRLLDYFGVEKRVERVVSYERREES